MNDLTLQERHALTDQLLTRLHEEPDLRAALRDDPKATLRRVLGLDIPDAVTVTALEETPMQRYLVLPYQAEEDEELTDAELEAIAAGTDTHRHGHPGEDGK